MQATSRYHQARPARIGIQLFLITCMAGCGGSAETSGDGSASAERGSIEVDACGLLATADASDVLGEAVGDPTRGLQNPGSERTAAISICGYSTPSGREVNLMARRSPTKDNTASAIANVREGSAAFGPLEDVAGLGDTAFAVRFTGENVVQLHVFWGGDRYQMVTVSGFDHDTGIERAKTVARRVIERLP